jgi:outer membrane protein assembly factor BamD (BamD/ComL family)
VPLIALAPLALAQEGAEEQARRLLEDGRSYRDQGKLKQALDNFNIVVNSFAGTDAVGYAWLEIGRYRMEVEGDRKGAREAFEQVSREHAQSDAAPGAYHYLGLLTLEAAGTPEELDDALAQFARVETLYPRSPWVPRSLQASALVHRRAGRYDDAVALDRRVALEYPQSDAAPRAQFEVGHVLALQGEPRRAMEAFQQVRNRFPESAWAESALERVTALYRLHGSARPVFTVDAGFSVSGGNVLKDVRALLVTPDRRLWIASNKTKSAVAFEPSGEMGESISAQDPRSLSLGPGGEVVLAARSAVRVGTRDIRTFFFPPEKPGEEREPLDRILAAALLPGGSFLVSDEDENSVFRFGAAGELEGRFFKDARKWEVTRIVMDGERSLYLLDREEKMIAICDESGHTVRTIGPSGLRDPVDLVVDPFRNVYVADEDEGILVFNARGEPFFEIGGPELRKATAVALDATGAVLVYDDRSDQVLRYR